MQLGLPVPDAVPAMPVAQVGAPVGVAPVAPAPAGSAVIPFAPRPDPRAVFEEQQSKTHITQLAMLIRNRLRIAEDARREVETEMVEAMLARRGQYTDEKRRQIAANNQPEIYMMLAAAKMRQIEALIRDVLIGSGSEKPWTLAATPVPELPPELVMQIMQGLQMEVEQALAMGLQPTMEEVRQRMRQAREQLEAQVREEARVRVERMETKMEDQLVEGGFIDALDQFVTDYATFKTAFLKGPIIRKKPVLSWGENGEVQVEEKLVKEWERVDPFNVYPAPHAKHVQDAWLIEKHSLTREALTQMIGVEGYSEEAIREVLDRYGETGHHESNAVTSQKLDAEGKNESDIRHSDLIDAYQYWGSASGKTLTDWGVEGIEDPAKEYQVEAWLVDNIVIKAVLNSDPLARRPYYASSYQKVPGSIWGNAPYDLMKDCQDMCNGAARALAANMGVASGPQTWVMADRLADGEEITTMHPWKLWQVVSDPMGGTAAPIGFFQPQSNANELMTVYERFSLMADEYTGIPRYMAGFNGGEGGAGRTASGISMMIGNATKTIKQSLAGIDADVITNVLDLLYYYNMRYGDDPDLKGDVRIVARGALSLATKEAAQMRLNEFLAATGNPIDMQIIGMEGRAELLRHAVKRLDVNPDKVVPSLPVLKERMMMQQMAQMQQQQQQAAQSEDQNRRDEELHQSKLENTQASTAKTSKEILQDGTPVTDTFSPKGQ